MCVYVWVCVKESVCEIVRERERVGGDISTNQMRTDQKKLKSGDLAVEQEVKQEIRKESNNSKADDVLPPNDAACTLCPSGS